MPRVDIPIDSNFSLRIPDLQTEHEVSGAVGRDSVGGAGVNPGIVTFRASGIPQIVNTRYPSPAAIASAVTAAAASGEDPPQDPYDVLPKKWQIGFYQVVLELKRIIFRQTPTEGRMGLLSRVVGSGGEAHRSGYSYEQSTIRLAEPVRDASDDTSTNFEPWYDSNGSVTSPKAIFKGYTQNLFRYPGTPFNLSMSDAPGILLGAMTAKGPRIIGLKQEALFMTFLLLLNTDKRDLVFHLASWSWTANFVYLKPGEGPPITRGGLIVTSHDQTARLNRQMPYPEIKDHPIGKVVLNEAPVGAWQPVMDLDMYLL